MAIISFSKKWPALVMLFMALLLIPTASLTQDTEGYWIGSGVKRGQDRLSSLMPSFRKEVTQTPTIADKPIQVKEQSQAKPVSKSNLNAYEGQQQGESCGITCLTCEKGECTRYNWIAVICLGMLVGNLLALLYFITIVRKLRGRPTTKDSLLTEGSGSLVRSTAYE